ncbi:MAG TPA: DinB family protein [Bryobacteraceae bacterium]|nr:DinB family protein [Bryobacteraceae bacterium]
MTKGERQRLVADLQMTAKWLEDETAHLSQAQLEYHPAPDQWSVIDVLGHLNLAEPIYWQQLRDALKEEPSGKKGQVTDNDVLWYGIDRTIRQKTSPNKVPKSLPADLQARLAAFRKLHAEILEYAQATSDDLRAHGLEKEGTDAYQWVLMISTHAQRHILQIREIKASRGFPAS